MPTNETLIQIELAEVFQSVDDSRDPSDPFKAPTDLRTLLNTRLANLKAKDAATLLTEGDRTTASGKVRAALEVIQALLRDGYNHVKGIESFNITDAERLGLFTAYGWVGGKLGDIDAARAEALANQAITASPTISNPDWRYSDALLTHLTDQLAILNANQPLALGGTRQQATEARDLALVLLTKANSRVRFFYCMASDDLDSTTELARIGRRMRRGGGGGGGGEEELEGELPATPGTATLDEAALTLSVPELPEHATSIRAYRQLTAGGDPELAGTSATTTVSVIEAGPLEGDQEYNVWVVGNNAAGEGPPSNAITFIAPV